ncbi:MAG: glycosyltransferase family 4 protein [Bacteroidales bacterium]|nr:glycosyltransferase family 4 protein [Bacteroidales bacterium]
MIKKKIIRATTVPGSLNSFCRDLLRELSVKYEVIALSSPGEQMREIEIREGVRTIAIPMERHISLKRDFVSLWRLVKVFRKEKPTMVHSMTPKAGMLCMVAAWITRVPLRVHTFTGLVFPTSTGLKRKILMATDKLTCFCATHVIPEGEGVKNDLLYNRITNKPLRVLGYGNVRGVDMEHYSRRPEVMKLTESLRDDSCFTFLFVGRIVKDKGINELCSAYKRLHEQFPNTRLWLVGRFEDKLDPINQESRVLIEKEGNGLEAVGMKFGDELLAYYASADCYVSSSYREGFPNTVLEAGAMELPSIVTDINGSREIIIQGENGYIIPSKNENALFDAMKRMICQPDERKIMASKSRKMVADRYEQGFVRKCLYDFYDEIFDK